MKSIFTFFSRFKARIANLWTSPPPDQVFDEAFAVFKAELGRKSRERATRLAQSLSRLSASPEFQKSAQPFVQRHRLYAEYANEIGTDFIEDMKSIIMPHCDQILPSHVKVLKAKIQTVLASRREQAKNSDSSFAATMRPREIAQALHPEVESIFNSASSRFCGLIESTIEKANLQAKRKRRDEHKKRRIEILKELIKWGFTGGGIAYLGSLILREIGIIK
jgi:hypothetical protein